jgi:hypothetical protein
MNDLDKRTKAVYDYLTKTIPDLSEGGIAIAGILLTFLSAIEDRDLRYLYVKGLQAEIDALDEGVTEESSADVKAKAIFNYARLICPDFEESYLVIGAFLSNYLRGMPNDRFRASFCEAAIEAAKAYNAKKKAEGN